MTPRPPLPVVDTVEEALQPSETAAVSAFEESAADLDIGAIAGDFTSSTKAPLAATTVGAALR